MGVCGMTDREHDQLLATATDRFERRLSEEMGAVRVAMIEQDAATRQEIRQEISNLRIEVSEGDTATRLEIARVRLDMAEQFAASRVHTEARHRELLKWAFVFWVGQAIAVAGMFKAFT